ncbi:Uu.00g134440.m01.CDS01 [Anthostomella pinea]|uniref:Uu.00g134440.m01.CDS01 n=1 Tax=Anthostomella pinea TaxID=933095 RepID=A0AAI8YKY1_9PEZI|nr:Uu.00g134440.m01.CDS01 [Anthostomella pinea]
MASQNQYPLLSHQPLRLLFQLTYIGTVVARLPYWLIVALVRPFRPHQRWTTKQSFMTRVMYAMLDMTSHLGITETLSLKKKNEGNRFQIIDPSPLDVYEGPLASVVKPQPVGGTWFPHAPDPNVASQVVGLYFHGGAFVMGDGRTDSCGFSANLLLDHGGVDTVLSLQYRLSGYSGINPFPAALQDAVTAYLFLVNQMRIPGHRIVILGDSAGGNLTIALLRYIQDFGAGLGVPNPGYAVLFSPWVAPLHYDTANHRNRGADYLPTSFLRWGARAYSANLTDASSRPYITPLGNPFTTPVPIFVNTGSAELFLDADTHWVEEMAGVDGNVIESHLEDAACHDTFLAAKIIGFEESARDVAIAVGGFIRKHRLTHPH